MPDVKQGKRHADLGGVLDIQLKSSTRAIVGAEHVSYDLAVKAYNDLRNPKAVVPRILVILVLPKTDRSRSARDEEVQ